MSGNEAGGVTGHDTGSVAGGDAVTDYKRLLQTVCDNRPSGTRGRLAAALGTNRSFVSQLTNPAYTMPIPAQHLDAIFEVCRFSPAEQAAFLGAYDRAHPSRREGGETGARARTVSLKVPDLGDARRNQAMDKMLAEYARQLIRFAASLQGDGQVDVPNLGRPNLDRRGREEDG